MDNSELHDFDVIIVGAGIAGVGGAYHLSTQCPDARFTVLESQSSFGGTWLTHSYPGVRSDSDLHTFGYRFKPWTGKPIAEGRDILSYIGEVIEENDLGRHIRYGHRVVSADWSDAEMRWTLLVDRKNSGEPARLTTKLLWMCQGYYRHSEGYTPKWNGMADFGGQIVHPQQWPSDLDTTGKRVVVIGSGATAATLIPALADRCKSVTMLQRSPTYFRTGRNADPFSDELRELKIPEEWVHEIARRRMLRDQALFMQRAFKEPEIVRGELLAAVRAHLGNDYDIETHFTPSYRPWRQRVAYIPDADLFKAIAAGKAGVVTDGIDRFTFSGLMLKSGKVLDADIVITATGFELNVMGDVKFSVNGEELSFSDTVTFHGMMFTNVPNLVWIFGYFRASWTLRVDLVSDFVCRLLNHMTQIGAGKVVPVLTPDEPDMVLSDWVDPENFNPGYLLRGGHLLPRSGTTAKWQHTQDYWADKDTLPAIDLTDPSLSYS